MSFQPHERRDKLNTADAVMVQKGEIVISEESLSLATVVGPGAAVCIWADGGRVVAGMCHFVQPVIYDLSKATAWFGNVAVVTLIKKMRAIVPDAMLEAQIFGGASRDAAETLGERNVEIARKALTNRGVRIVSEDVGGSRGRKILFDTASGHTAVLKVQRIRDEDWESQGNCEVQMPSYEPDAGT
jgi:chemotaxis protein CheD